jgi:site-specific recombinase XerD
MGRRKTHPGHIEELPSGNIRVRLSVAGHSYRKTLKGVSRDEAATHLRRKADQLERADARGKVGIDARLRISELLDRFRVHEFPDLAPNTRKSYETSFSFVVRFFEDQGDPLLEDVHPAHLREYMTWRRKNPGRGDSVSARTVAKDRRVLHRLFSFAEDQELREGNPVRPVKAPKSDGRTPILLTQDELDDLVDALEDNPMARLYVLLLAETGLRAYSEALHLRWEDLDLGEGFLHVRSGREGHRTKSGHSRWVPLTPAIRSELRDHAAQYRLASYREKRKSPARRSRWVFHHVRTHGKARAGARVGSFQKTIEDAVEEAGIPDGWRLHDLRHRRVTKWLAEGKPAVLVKEAMGHSSLEVTMGYTHLAREHLRALVEVEKPPEKLRELAR